MTGKWELPWEGEWKGHPSSLNYQRRDLCKEQATSRGCRRIPGEERELCGIIHMNSVLSLDLQQSSNNSVSFCFQITLFFQFFFQINDFLLIGKSILCLVQSFFFPVKVTYLPTRKTPTAANLYICGKLLAAYHIVQKRMQEKKPHFISSFLAHSQGVTSDFLFHNQEFMRLEGQESENVIN